jgi:hypothetical protein
MLSKKKMDSNQAKGAKQEEMLAEMNAKMDANMTKMAAIWSELEETMERRMMAMWNTDPEVTEKTEPNPGMMQSAV